MGIAGGRPNSSLFFAGYQGDNLVYYDPHFIRPSLPLRDINSYQHKDLFSYHCDKVRFLRISSLDPSMVLGFLVKNKDEFLSFCENVKDVRRHHELLLIHSNYPTLHLAYFWNIPYFQHSKRLLRNSAGRLGRNVVR